MFEKIKNFGRWVLWVAAVGYNLAWFVPVILFAVWGWQQSPMAAVAGAVAWLLFLRMFARPVFYMGLSHIVEISVFLFERFRRK